VYDITFFKHQDGRSPNFYCLFAHPKTGKRLQNKVDILNQPAYSYLRDFFDFPSAKNAESTDTEPSCWNLHNKKARYDTIIPATSP